MSKIYKSFLCILDRLFFVVFVLLLFSCKGSAPDILEYQEVDLSPCVCYIVTTSPYTRFYKEADFLSDIVGSCNEMQIFLVTGLKLCSNEIEGTQKIKWYQCNINDTTAINGTPATTQQEQKGWVCETQIKVFATQLQAKAYIKKNTKSM